MIIQWIKFSEHLNNIEPFLVRQQKHFFYVLQKNRITADQAGISNKKKKAGTNPS